MRARLLLLASLLGLGLPGVGIAQAGRIWTPTELVRNAAKMDGQVVVVRGIVEIGPERRCIHDNDGFLTLHNSKLLRRPAHRWSQAMTLTGTFRKKLNGPNDIDMAECGEAGLEIMGVVGGS